jgi:Insertion element 4 transposase N-terminal/Transposase DDE domain
MGGRWSSALGRVLAGIQIGVLARWVTPGLVDEVLAEAGQGAAGQRFRALPGRLGVYFVLGLCLFAGLPYQEVLRELAAGLGGALEAAGWQVPASTALTGVRRRLGERPFELLFRRLAGALGAETAPGSLICGLAAAAWDGTTVKVPASEANIAAFGRPGGRKDGHYPQVRLVTLIACGTRGLLGAAAGPLHGKGTGEQTLARDLLGGLRAGMLLLADRNFYGYGLWTAAAGTGADLLWRVTATVNLLPVRPLPDGSWLAHVNDPAEVIRRARRNAARRRRGSTLPPETGPLPGITVRVIEFRLTVTTDDEGTRTEGYRLITTLLDYRACPAAALAAGYARRWAIETGLREFKTYLRGPGRILRSRTPELARQELWAYLIIYQAIRVIMSLAAAGAGTSPDRISFTAALHAVRRTLPAGRAGSAAALAQAQASILTVLVPRRQGRTCVRAVTQPSSPFPSRRNAKGPLSQHAGFTVTIRPPDQASPNPTDQARHQPEPENQPP